MKQDNGEEAGREVKDGGEGGREERGREGGEGGRGEGVREGGGNGKHCNPD